MLPEERLYQISQEVKKNKFCSVSALAAQLGVSVATIRRDLQHLSEQGKVRLTRGGAAYISQNRVQEPDHNAKTALNLQEKMRIAAAACKEVQRGDVIFLDTGTTTYQMAPGLQSIGNLTVATNDVRIAAELATSNQVSLCMLGGVVRRGYYTTTGIWTQEALEGLHVDRMFMSCDAVDINGGCSIVNADEVLLKQMMLKAGSECYLLVDHSKFESIAFMRMFPVESIRTIITGKELDEKIRQEYEALGIHMILA